MINFHDDKNTELNVKSFYMGSRYAQAFSRGIKANPKLKKLNISRNNLKDQGLAQILENISDYVEEIDLSYNEKITVVGYQKLGVLIDDPYKRYPLVSLMIHLA